MKLGVVGWAADSGVGRELIEAVRHLPVQCAFILHNPSKPTRTDLLPGNVRIAYSQKPSELAQMKMWLDQWAPDTILTWEIPGNWDFPDMWFARGIKWVHVIHADWFAPSYDHLWRRAKLITPIAHARSILRQRFNLDSTFLPVPVDTDRLRFRERREAKEFMSVYGYGGPFHRRSIPEILAAWNGMPSPPPLIIRAQVDPGEIQNARLHQVPVSPQIKVMVGNTPEPEGIYELGDVALQPSRYEGVGISLVEAQSRGVPVIAVNAPPMNEIAPDLLVDVCRTETIMTMGAELTSYVPSWESIRKRVSELSGKDIQELSHRARSRALNLYSWKALLPKWLEVLGS